MWCPLGSCPHFGGTCCVWNIGVIYKASRCHGSEDRNQDNHRRLNLSLWAKFSPFTSQRSSLIRQHSCEWSSGLQQDDGHAVRGCAPSDVYRCRLLINRKLCRSTRLENSSFLCFYITSRRPSYYIVTAQYVRPDWNRSFTFLEWRLFRPPYTPSIFLWLLCVWNSSALPRTSVIYTCRQSCGKDVLLKHVLISHERMKSGIMLSGDQPCQVDFSTNVTEVSAGSTIWSDVRCLQSVALVPDPVGT
jgi:hypothetical protein